MKIQIKDLEIGLRKREANEDKVEELSESMKELGLIQPIAVVWIQGNRYRLVAGLHRVAAALDLGWTEIEANILRGMDDDTEELVEIDENLIRYDLEFWERLELIERRREIHIKIYGQEIKPTKGGSNPLYIDVGESESDSLRPKPFIKDTVDTTGLKKRSVEQDIQIIDSIPSDIRHKARAANIPKTEALKLARIKEPEQQKKIIDKIESGAKNVKEAQKVIKKEEKRQAIADAAPPETDETFNIFHGDFRKIGSQIEDESVSMIFTDPPYDKETVPQFSDLSEFAARVLKPGGHLITFFGQYSLPEVVSRLSEHLDYHWILACIHTGQSATYHPAKVMIGWKPMLWFTKGKSNSDEYVRDSIKSEQSKEFHDWGQGLPEAQYFIEHLTKPGELIIDPFCGGGTTAYAARSLKRDWWSCDINEEQVNIARGRLSE